MCRSTAGPPLRSRSVMPLDQSACEITRMNRAARSLPYRPDDTVSAAKSDHFAPGHLAIGEVVDHAHEANAHYADPYHLCNSCVAMSLWFPMLPTLPTVLASFSTFLVNSLKFSLRLNH